MICCTSDVYSGLNPFSEVNYARLDGLNGELYNRLHYYRIKISHLCKFIS